MPARRGSGVTRFAESLERPHILRITAPQDVPVAALHHHTEVRRARRVPAVLHNSYFFRSLAKQHAHRPLLTLISSVAFPLHKPLSQRRPLLCGFPPVPHSTPRPEK